MNGLQFVLQQSATGATPLLLAGYGELLGQRAGVINIGIEGTMLMGAIAAYGAAVYTGSAAATILMAMTVGMLFGGLFALVAMWFRADQIVAGTAINILAAGASTTAFAFVEAHRDGRPVPDLFGRVAIPGLDKIPIVGAALFTQYALFYVAVALLIALFLLLTRTRAGLIIRALGDAPDSANAAGLRVRWWRTGLLLFAGALSGLAGAYLSTMRINGFTMNMTDGRGFLVLALVIFARWNLWAFALVTLAFGSLDSLQTLLSAIPGATARVPHQLFDMLPYLATLLALALLGNKRGSAAPLMLGRAWPD